LPEAKGEDTIAEFFDAGWLKVWQKSMGWLVQHANE